MKAGAANCSFSSTAEETEFSWVDCPRSWERLKRWDAWRTSAHTGSKMIIPWICIVTLGQKVSRECAKRKPVQHTSMNCWFWRLLTMTVLVGVVDIVSYRRSITLWQIVTSFLSFHEVTMTVSIQAYGRWYIHTNRKNPTPDLIDNSFPLSSPDQRA